MKPGDDDETVSCSLGSISWPSGIEPRKRRRTGSRPEPAQREAADTASRAEGLCGAGSGEAGGRRSAGGTGGGERREGPRRS